MIIDITFTVIINNNHNQIGSVNSGEHTITAGLVYVLQPSLSVCKAVMAASGSQASACMYVLQRFLIVPVNGWWRHYIDVRVCGAAFLSAQKSGLTRPSGASGNRTS